LPSATTACVSSGCSPGKSESRAGHFAADGADNFFEHAGIKEESRAEIELVAVRLEAGRAPTNDGQTFEDSYLQALRRQQNGGSESARAGADD
jgi:hypothetical protein